MKLVLLVLISTMAFAQDAVNLISPANMGTFGGNMWVLATAYTTHRVKYTQLYVDGVKRSQTALPYIDTNVNLTVGTHRVTVQYLRTDGVTVKKTVMVTATPAITITSPAQLVLQVGVHYSGQFKASGGTGTYTWTATGLPPGLTLSSNGVLSGTPTANGIFNFNITVTDANGQVANVAVGS